MIIQSNGMELSSVPTLNHKQLIYLRVNETITENLERLQKENPNPKDLFRFSTNKKYIQAYADPSELSYNSYENILNMDECFFSQKLSQCKDNLIQISNLEKVHNFYKFQVNDRQNLLMQLHKMDLYTLPFNNLSRGGKRMIFSSLKLADVLFKGLKENLDQQSELSTNFNSINHVFRLNCFSSNTGNFKSHFDTPFSDSQRKLYSKFTLLIYLTGGANYDNSCLRIENQKINEIPAFTGIIFDQRYEHEGWPYIQGEKIFLRTQLIYHIKDIESDDTVAQMFNKACYFHKQSLSSHSNNPFAEELQKYSNDLFNHTAKLRYFLGQLKEEIQAQKQSKQKLNEVASQTINLNNQIESKYLLKKSFDIVYTTDGNSFWFRDCAPLKFIAQLVLVDYFNGRMEYLSSQKIKESNKARIKSKPFRRNLSEEFRQKVSKQQKLNENMEIQNSLTSKLTPYEAEEQFIDQQIIQFLEDISFDDQKQAKPYPYGFDQVIGTQTKDIDIMEYHCGFSDCSRYTSEQQQHEAQKLSLQRLYNRMDGIGVVLFNGKVCVRESMIKVNEQRGQISFNNAFLNKTINFASCQCESYRRNKYIAKRYFEVQGFLLPKIHYKRLPSCKGIKLSIDMFKNGFIHKVKVQVSKPEAVQPYRTGVDEQFYDQNDQYIDSDSDYDEVVGKRRQHKLARCDRIQIEDESDDQNTQPRDTIKKRINMEEQN